MANKEEEGSKANNYWCVLCWSQFNTGFILFVFVFVFVLRSSYCTCLVWCCYPGPSNFLCGSVVYVVIVCGDVACLVMMLLTFLCFDFNKFLKIIVWEIFRKTLCGLYLNDK